MNLGYACINMELSEKGISTNRGMIKRTFQNRGKDYAADLALKNLEDLLKVLEWNEENGIKVYRMSSCLFPWMSEYEFIDLHNFYDILKICGSIGRLAESSGQRLSFHPGHFDILATNSENSLKNTLRDLNQHSEIMDLMGLRNNWYNTINIHIGGAYGDKATTLKRFCENFYKLEESTKQRLTVENDDKVNMYSVKDLYDGVYKEIGIPIIFDYHHHSLCPGGLTEEEALKLAASTWPPGTKTLTHYSSSKKIYEDSGSNAQAHADHVYNKINQYGMSIDIEIEAKAKEKAVFTYLEKFS